MLGIAAGVIGSLLVWRAALPEDDQGEYARLVAGADSVSLDAATVSRIETFCGDCHAVPRPESFPRYAWHKEVRMGYEVYAKSGRTDLDPPPIHQSVAYYRSRAPERLSFPDPPEADKPLGVTFQVDRLRVAETGGIPSAVAHLNWIRLENDVEPTLVVCDMRRGAVLAASPADTQAAPRLLARLDNPCHAEPCDLDGDGAIDLVVADLGSYPPMDHDRGRVVWLRRREGDGSYEVIVIASGLGRVADVRPGDFDGDGDLDLIVGVFGMDRTGDILLLRNTAGMGEMPRFESEVIDPRPGTIHVPPCDFNGDGYLDFIALISQEYEQVAIFMNQTGSTQKTTPFHMQLLWEGPDLTFGSSGLVLTDLDADGDVDLLYTNGDAFDNGFVNPSHGVQWLENQGNLRFAYHRLTDMTGAYAAESGDIDLDGDLDIVAVAWLPGTVEPPDVFDSPLASIICLEQISPGVFVRHTLEKDNAIHATMELADFDNDGDLDLVVGSHTLARKTGIPHWLAVWWNQARP